METDEPRYTLAEARRELARRECATSRHDWDVLYEMASNDPNAILCVRCGRILEVVRGD